MSEKLLYAALLALLLQRAVMLVSILDKVYCVKEILAHVLLYRGKYHHITLAIAENHWLLVKQLVSFKLSSMGFNIKWNNLPSY